MIKEHLAEKRPSPATTRSPRILPCQVVTTCNPGTRATGISQHLTFPYTIRNLTLYFPAGCDNLVRAYPIIALDPSAPTAALPPGFLMLSEFSPTPYLIGDEQTLSIPLDHIVGTKGTWLKIHLYNLDLDTHTVAAIFSLREILEEP